MKLYIWRNVYCDWTCGIAFAMANSIEEARAELMKTKSNYEHVEWDREPDEVHEQPFGDHIWGGG